MKDLADYYQSKFGFSQFYSIVKSRSVEACKENSFYSNEFIKSSRFLQGVTPLSSVPEVKLIIEPENESIRIDVPVWFGDHKKSRKKFIIYGLEPRGTDSKFNVEVVDKHIFATPFGCDRWNLNSSIARKPQNKYFTAFYELICRDDSFILFSDIVKEYHLKSNKFTHESKMEHDKNARKYFKEGVKKYEEMLFNEIEMVKPNNVIALGSLAKNTLDLLGVENVKSVRHPSYGGQKVAAENVKNIIESNL